VQATGPPAISQLLAKWREGDHEALRLWFPCSMMTYAR